MGFFSWNTQDTNKSIANKHSSRKTFTVTMLDDKGNRWTETEYSGYGVFGGKDFYTLLAEMNGHDWDKENDPDMEEDRLRSLGIEIAFSNKPYKSPNLVKNIDKWKYIDQPPRDCEFQGYFY